MSCKTYSQRCQRKQMHRNYFRITTALCHLTAVLSAIWYPARAFPAPMRTFDRNYQLELSAAQICVLPFRFCALRNGHYRVTVSTMCHSFLGPSRNGWIQGDHLSRIPGNVREFEACQGNVRKKFKSSKSVPKLFITSWIFAFPSKQYLATYIHNDFILGNHDEVIGPVFY